jgi:hypothetical protein
MSKHIHKLDIDIKLSQGDPYLVNAIASGHEIISTKTRKELNFYSFATKYCNWYNRGSFAIYDSFVHKVLIAYKRQDSFTSFQEADLKYFPQVYRSHS